MCWQPELRFPEFRGAPGWDETQLQKIARAVSERAVTGDGDNVLSLSGEHGLVLQSDYFGKKVWDATSPIAGVVLYIGAVPSLKKGDTIAHIGEIGK